MRFYSSFIQLCVQASQQTKPNKTWSAAVSATSRTLKGRSLTLSYPPQILPSFLFLHPNHSQCFELTTFVFSNYFHSSAWRTDLENKHKLIPNTLIISNEHLSYSISEEPMCYTVRKPRDWRARRWKRTAAGAASASREARRVLGARFGRSSGGRVRACSEAAQGSAVSAGRPGRGRRARGSRAARAGAALCWPQRRHRTSRPSARQPAFPAAQMGKKTTGRLGLAAEVQSPFSRMYFVGLAFYSYFEGTWLYYFLQSAWIWNWWNMHYLLRKVCPYIALFQYVKPFSKQG